MSIEVLVSPTSSTILVNDLFTIVVVLSEHDLFALFVVLSQVLCCGSFWRFVLHKSLDGKPNAVDQKGSPPTLPARSNA